MTEKDGSSTMTLVFISFGSCNVGSPLTSKAKSLSSRIRQAVYDFTLTSNGIFAYEVNGFGGQYIMDHANVPVGLSPLGSGEVGWSDDRWLVVLVIAVP